MMKFEPQKPFYVHQVLSFTVNISASQHCMGMNATPYTFTFSTGRKRLPFLRAENGDLTIVVPCHVDRLMIWDGEIDECEG